MAAVREYLDATKAAAGFGFLLVLGLSTVVVPVALVLVAAVDIGTWWAVVLALALAAVYFVLAGALVVYLVDRW